MRVNRDYIMPVRLTREEKLAIQEAAQKIERPSSVLVRMAALGVAAQLVKDEAEKKVAHDQTA